MLELPRLLSVSLPSSLSCVEVATYTRPIRVYSIVLITLSNLVEVVFIQLSYKRRKVAVFKVFRQDEFCEFLVL